MLDRKVIIVGSRVSPLALAQTQIVIDLLVRKLGLRKTRALATEKEKGKTTDTPFVFEIKKILTAGDVRSRSFRRKLSGKADFTRAIDDALLRGEIDIAVHSLKDVPIEDTRSKRKIAIGAYPERDSPFDALILRERSRKENWNNKGNRGLQALKEGATIGTSSLRRKIQIKAYRPDLKIVDIHGNVQTRINKLRNASSSNLSESNLDAIVLAEAGLRRLGLGGEIDQVIPKEIVLPAAGQGCLAVSVRADDTKMMELVSRIDHKETRIAVTAERAFSRELGGGCNTPVAALATIRGGRERIIVLEGMAANQWACSDETSQHAFIIRDSLESKKLEDPEALGSELGRRIKSLLT